jgi:hypothetical protein
MSLKTYNYITWYKHTHTIAMTSLSPVFPSGQAVLDFWDDGVKVSFLGDVYI